MRRIVLQVPGPRRSGVDDVGNDGAACLDVVITEITNRDRKRIAQHLDARFAIDQRERGTENRVTLRDGAKSTNKRVPVPTSRYNPQFRQAVAST